MKTVKEINALIARSHGWTPTVGTDTTSCFQLMDFMHKPIGQLTTDDLELVDYRLPIVIKALMSTCNHDKEYVHGSWARSSLMFWERGAKEVKDLKGDTHNMLEAYWVRKERPGEDKKLLLRGMFAVIASCEASVNGKITKIDYCARSSKNNVSVDLKWMDQAYPGWDARLLTLQTLGESEEHIANNLLIEKIKTNTLPLPDMYYSC